MSATNQSLIVSVITCSITALSISAFAQNRPQSTPPTPPKSVVGTIEGVSGNVIHIRSGVQFIALYVDDRTEVWKGKVFHDLSAVEAGDRVTARYRIDAVGNLVAETVWLNIVNFFGIITKIGDEQFEILTNPNADPQSAYKKENKIVALDADTIFEASAHDDLKQGREVQVVGLDLLSGRILATRVIIYEGKRPVRMGEGKIRLPNGQIR
jgi:hypothetical protein